ncbi:MAG TPA: hypothetical protein VNL34_02530 [Candidatus Nitrosotenuis sp.]|nr:hypothetical protein [Candidatus Nitrosotenuis sp.]
MIGLLIVFGVIGVAFLSLSSQQTSLFATQQNLNELQHDRNTETFVGKILYCKEFNATHTDFVTIRINNTSSQTSNLNSFIVYNIVYQNVTDSGYFNNTKISVQAQQSMIFDLTDIRYDLEAADSSPEPDEATRMVLISDLGNKIIFDYDFDTNCIP